MTKRFDYKSYFEKMRERIVEDGESFDELTIYCPHCGEEQEQEEWPEIELNDTPTAMECDACENNFFARAKIVYSSTKDNGE